MRHLPTPRAVGDRAPVPLQHAALVWLGAWMVGQLVASAVAAASGYDSIAQAGPGWLFAVAMAGWVPLVLAVWSSGRKFGVGSFAIDFGFSFKPADLWGIPVGVLTQLVLLRLVYWPLEHLWPSTFAQDRIEQRARDLYDNASGAGVLLLILVVVVGAPMVEELVYRGLLQGAFTRRMREWLGMAFVALWFAVVHFQPVETPGLFVVGLVLGTCALLSGRLGLGVVAHMAFNATGLVLVAYA
jgi:membrane protease YdiL (CAAX protease family)